MALDPATHQDLLFVDHDSDDVFAVTHLQPEIQNLYAQCDLPHIAGNFIAHVIIREERARRKVAGDVKFLPAFMQMPFELILGHFHPMDLYHLGQTTTYFRNLITSHNSIPLWKSSFLNSDVPINPEDMSLLKWTSLLFGRDTCSYCGNGGASIDFIYRRRCCNPCLALHYTPIYGRHQFDAPYPTGHLVWKLTPPFYKPEGKDCHATYLYGSVGARYPLARLHATAKLIMDTLSEAERTGSMVVFEEVKRSHSVNVASLLAYGKICEDWARTFYDRARAHWTAQAERLRERLQNRLFTLGYIQKDFEAGLFALRSLLSKTGKLSRLKRRDWRKIKPDVIEILESCKEERLAKEREMFMKSRRDALKRAYREYQPALSPSTWAYLPPCWAVEEFPTFSELMLAPSDRVS